MKEAALRVPPGYIQDSGVLNLPAKFTWRGTGLHYGPEQGTKVHTGFQKLTVSSLATVCALLEEWLLWRLNASMDARLFLDHVDSVLAWEIDPRYRDEASMKFRKDTPVNQAVRDAVWSVHLATVDELWRHPEVSDDKAAAVVSVTRQTMTGKPLKAFNSWLDFALARAAKLEPWPRKRPPRRADVRTEEEYFEVTRPYFGRPLPREALDPIFDYRPEQREELLSRFLEGLDWKKNPFLRSPDQMKKLGFRGTPYRL